MKSLFSILCLILLIPAAWAKHVPEQDAQKLAVTFYRLNNPQGISEPGIKSATTYSREDLPTFYIFRFVSRGFIIVAADDASTPILGYSFENDLPEVVTNPAAKEWLDNYSREIAYIIDNKLDNTETRKEWSSTLKGRTIGNTADVGPLLTTKWDQGCYYNTLCPADTGAPCGHVYTGCVSTAMAQIMKYHNFPPMGIGQSTYTDGNYGQQTADFGATPYDWAAMPDSASAESPIATIIYHAGVAVEMGYGRWGSGAQSERVRGALLDYFNYSPEMEVKYKDNFDKLDDFKSLLRNDLDAGFPVHYAGYGPYGGHDFVCDGYRLSDGKFHFNWGWSGLANGYYTVSTLNPSGYTFNKGQLVTLHIKPYHTNLIVRIINPVNNAMSTAGSSVTIKAKVVRGSAGLMKILIDNIERHSAAGDSIAFTWNTSVSDVGTHIVKAYAMNETDTVYYQVSVSLANMPEWIQQSSGLNTPRVISYLSAIDGNTVWGVASDAVNPWWATCSDFIRTTNGGTTWTPGVITNTAGLVAAMIFGLDPLKAYAPMFNITATIPQQGIYMTSDGGTTWTRQASASFSESSWPQMVHFFNMNDGVCMGNPLNREFEIYVTADGGTHWAMIPGSDIPNPLSSELGVAGCYSAVNDTIWFGTTMGRVYRSVDKGQHWTVATVNIMSGKYVKPVFRTGSHGLVLDELSGAGLICETFNGGTTWTQVNYTGPNYSGDLAYVPGTPNTWVKSGFLTGPLGCAYSFDGGHTWADFIGTPGSPFSRMAWINDHCGWSGGINSGPTENGVQKFTGSLLPQPAPQNVQAIAGNDKVDISWDAPSFDPLQLTLQGYDITRNGTRLNTGLISGSTWSDGKVTAGKYTYCVAAQYTTGASQGICTTLDVASGIDQAGFQAPLEIWPNPAHGRITIKASLRYRDISACDQLGNAIPITLNALSEDTSTIDISGIPAGIYYISVITDKGIYRSRLVVY